MDRKADGMAQQTHQEKVLEAQVDLLYQQAPSGFVATVANATILVAALWGVIESMVLVSWYGYILAVTAGRYALVRSYRRPSARARPIGVWLGRFTAGAALAGIGWGLEGTLLFPHQSPAHQTLVFILLAGITAGGMPFLSPVPRVYMVFLLPALLPLVLWLFWQGETAFVALGMMALLFSAVLVTTALRIGRNIAESLRLRYENTELVDTLTTSKGELERTNARLTAEVAERQRAEGELRNSHQFLEKVMDSATNAIFVLDPQGRLTRFNRALKQIAGCNEGQLLGQPFPTLLSPKSRKPVLEQFSRVTAEGHTTTPFEAELVDVDGRVRTLALSLAPLREGGESGSIVGTAEDISERKQVERMKDEFVSTVSHELRTPLTAIRGALGLLRGNARGELSAEIRPLVELGYKNCDRLLYLINDLLDIQRLDSGEISFRFGRHDLGALVEQAIELHRPYGDEFGVRILFEGPAPAARVRVDADRFLQILTNLLSNAVKFSPRGETVRVGVICNDGKASVSISDRGPGVPENFRQRIFQRFAQADASDTRQKGGTGLGLYITKTLAEKMNGAITLSSEEGRGSTFIVQFPVAENGG